MHILKKPGAFDYIRTAYCGADVPPVEISNSPFMPKLNAFPSIESALNQGGPVCHKCLKAVISQAEEKLKDKHLGKRGKGNIKW